jgi:hypothetical protein
MRNDAHESSKDRVRRNFRERVSRSLLPEHGITLQLRGAAAEKSAALAADSCADGALAYQGRYAGHALENLSSQLIVRFTESAAQGGT